MSAWARRCDKHNLERIVIYDMDGSFNDPGCDVCNREKSGSLPGPSLPKESREKLTNLEAVDVVEEHIKAVMAVIQESRSVCHGQGVRQLRGTRPGTEHLIR